MRLQAVVKRLCLSSTVEVAVSTDALSLSSGLSPQSLFSLVLYLTHTFSSAILFLLLLFPHFRFNYFITCYIHNVSCGLTCITPRSLSPLGPFLLFLLLTVFVSLKGKTVLPPHPAGTAPPLFFSDCFFAASAMVLCWYYPDGFH